MPVNCSAEENVNYVKAVFDKAMTAFSLPAKRFAVAVSGGSDSMALCRLLHDYVSRNGGELLALTVDHGLRSESSKEAAWVAGQMRALGISHRVLKWTGEKPFSNIEKTARDARYSLLTEACRAENFPCLFLGHHRQDQAETFLLRRAANSKESGLAAMSAVRSFAFGKIYRPLLGVSPEQLRLFNQSAGQKWVDDPTNFTDEFERGRLRQKLSAAEIEDAFQQSLIFGRQRIETEAKTSAFIDKSASISNMGYVLFSRADFCSLEADTARICLGDILRAVANKPYRPASESLEKLRENVQDKNYKGSTLGGCCISPAAKGNMIIWREFNDLPAPLSVTAKRFFYWDRFAFSFSEEYEKELTVGPLKNHLKVEKKGPKRCFFVLPALFNSQGLFLVPHLGYKQTSILCRVEFAPFFSLCKKPEWMCPVIL